MSCNLPEGTRCFLRSFGLIDKEASLFQAGLLTATDIEDASDHELLAAGLNRDQIRTLRYAFVFRDAFGLPDRVKTERSRLRVSLSSSAPYSAMPSPIVQVAAVQDAVLAFRCFLGKLSLSSKESSLAEAGFAEPLDLKEALDDELQAAGLSMVQICHVRRFFASEECSVARALTSTAAQTADVAVATEE